MRMRLINLAGLALLAGLLQGCFPNAFKEGAFKGERAGVLVAQDRRDDDARLDDRDIEAKAGNLVYKQSKVFMRVNVTSFNRKVLISGEVPDEATRTEVEQIISSVEKVNKINNELAVSGSSSLVSRSNDSLIGSNVKLRLVADGRLDSNLIKVVTENGTVFLMGIVNRAEADAAAEIASTTTGVQRVVKLFEYLD